MEKKYVILLSLIMLAAIFVSFMLLTENRDSREVETLVDYEKKKDVVFFSSWAGYDTKAEAVTDILIRFQEENEEINVVDKSTDGNDFLFTLKADFASGKDPDVFGLWPGSDIDLLIERGLVQPLDHVLASDMTWRNSFGDSGWDLVTYDQQIYGIPFEVIYEGLFINKTIFQELGLAEPETYEELKVAIRVLKDNGYIPIAYNVTPEGSFLYQNIVLSLGGKDNIENPFDEHGRIRSCFVEGMYYMKELYDMGAFPQDFLSLSNNERNRLFIDKKAGMIVQGSWFIGEDAVKPEATDVSIVPIPTFENSIAGDRAITYGLGNGVFHISSRAWEDEEKRSLAISLLKEMTSKEAALRLVNENGAQINVKLLAGETNAPNMYYEGRQLVQTATDKIGPVDSYIKRALWEGIIIDSFPAMYLGEKTPEGIFWSVEKEHSLNE